MNINPLPQAYTYDLKQSVSDNRLLGFWRMMTGFRRHYFGAVATLGLASVFSMMSFLLIRYFVDEALQAPNLAAILPSVALGFIGLALLQGFFSFLSGRLTAQTAEGVALRLRNYMFDHIQHLTFTYHDNMKTGELIQRCTADVDTVRRFFSEQAIGVGRIFILFVINFGALLSLHVGLALLSVIVIPPIVIMSLFFFRRVSKAWDEYEQQDAKLSTTLQENLSGVRVVKAFARQQYEQDKFEADNYEKFRRGRRFMLMHSGFWPITDVICGAQILVGYGVAAVMVLDGTLTLGAYLAYAGLLINIINPIRNLGRLIVQMSTGMVSFERVMHVIREEREPLTEGAFQPADSLKGEVVFNDVTFGYDPEAPVLKGISFTVRPGQTVALLGSTGSGKTSVVSLLPRFYDYTSGSITIDGVELRDYPRQYLRRQIGIVEQEPFLFSRSIRENITYGVGREVPDDEVIAAAQAAAIHEVIETFPDGYNTLVGERGVTLSGGQKQRVVLARTLLKNPRILILDDATSSVDAETEDSIREALLRLMQGRTSFVIAHRIQTVMRADLILVFDKGRIIQRGTHEELMAAGGMYRHVYDLQSRIEDELEKEIASVGLPL
ncbi:MAG: ABC transporter ATP-binding protein [Chloroflexi bacterium]|nr:ABC transporter ATP-binding protein [Chloroflexota bacterium]